ncbi:MAG: hypothetical protein JST41_09970 [Bacteroidetes bacterium]|nr:hypothetical protein [Bacteroidota bacterium]MBX7128891.1 hypothetical protein [Flavobacteriales bacterium]MCC6654269.1 hypothetical protein [Flavobacteriales bacterium]HMU12365.1 hypothetical protein [Flavobacteriales bacterium]HMW95817.1 hypothetical protein [Flavobacteriales bacterium]
MTKLQAAQAAIIRKVKATKSLATLRQVDLTLSLPNDEWLDNLPPAIRKALAESDDQIARGETVPHAEVMQRARRWANR